MKVLFCRCSQCKAARKGSYAQTHIKNAQRAARAEVKRALRCGEYNKLPIAIYAGYLG